MPRDFNHDESDILFSLFEHIPNTGDVQMLESHTSAPERSQRFGLFKLISDPPLHVVSTLGTHSNHVFLLITRNDPKKFLPVLGSVEREDQSKPFSYNEYINLDDHHLNAEGWVGAVLIEPQSSPILLGFLSEQKINRSHVTYFLTVMITAAEREYLDVAGVSALLSRFHDTHRNLIE